MMRRREFITLLGAAAAWPLAARAQQAAVPVIGFLDTGPPESIKANATAFRDGLKEAGYIEGQNVAFEFRRGAPGGLPALAADLVRRNVAVIVAAGGIGSPRAAISATATIPIVIAGGADPVKEGFVASLNAPGGNVTGVSFLNNELMSKRLSLLRDFLPQASTFAYLSSVTRAAKENSAGTVEAARLLGRQVVVLECRNPSDFEAAFVRMVEQRASAVMVSAFPLAFNNRAKVVGLASEYKIPAMYAQSQYVREGGLMSYSAAGILRQVAIQYVARILKGEKPANLPIQLPTNFELVINLKTAKALGLTVPPSLLAVADEVIE